MKQSLNVFCASLLSLSFSFLISGPKRQTPPTYPESVLSRDLDSSHPDELAILMDRASIGEPTALFILTSTKGEVFMRRKFPFLAQAEQMVCSAEVRSDTKKELYHLEKLALDWDYDAIQALMAQGTTIILERDVPRFAQALRSADEAACRGNLLVQFTLNSIFSNEELRKHVPNYYALNKDYLEEIEYN